MSVGATAEVKSKLSVVDVVGESVTLKKAGTTYKGLCPFHGEKTPSFVVTPARGVGAIVLALLFVAVSSRLGVADPRQGDARDDQGDDGVKGATHGLWRSVENRAVARWGAASRPPDARR